MAVKILIRRKFKPGTLKAAHAMLVQARKNAMSQKGYIQSETLTNREDPNLVLVLSMWKSKKAWDDYKKTAARKENERKHSAMLEGKTEYEVFDMGI
ncbi:MAG: hypothetical protein HKP41_18265 [Desulfobacterales bacterium]|nr:antibiotic biosynthesis monooxygenase [Deltaproteobacteria bacterium]NNK96299.1 hypothetical protein [Desulfobacterales bacterium]